MRKTSPRLIALGLAASALASSMAGSAPAPKDILTGFADRERTGWFSGETRLTPASVASGRFDKLWESPPLDPSGQFPARLYASPLYVNSLRIGTGPARGKSLPVVIAATNNGFVYAIAAGGRGTTPGTILWKTQFDPPCDLLWDGGPMGVLSTPIIDQRRKRLYVASCSAKAGWQVYALELATGRVLDGWPVSIHESVLDQPGLNRNRSEVPQPAPEARRGRFYIQRGALNLSADDRYLYVTLGQARGWMVAVDTRKAAVASAYSATPIPSDSVGGIWGSTGPAIDRSGAVFVVTGASGGQAQAAPVGNRAQSVLKFQMAAQTGLTLSGIYTPFNHCESGAADIDLGSSGVAIIPPLNNRKAHDELLALGGKQGNAYLLAAQSFSTPGREREPCGTDPASDHSLLPPGDQPHFGGRGPLSIFSPYSNSDGMLDRAKNRATPAYFRDQAGHEFLFFSGNSKDPEDTRVSVASSLIRVRLVRPRDGSPYLQTDQKADSFVLQNPGPTVISGRSDQAIVWLLDTDAPRSARMYGPKAPKPILYAIDPMTMKIIWQTTSGNLETSGKYNWPIVTRDNVFIGTDRIVAFGLK